MPPVQTISNPGPKAAAGAILSCRVVTRFGAQTVWLANAGALGRPLLALHGISRDARGLAAGLAPLALDQGRPLLVPAFEAASWPVFQRLTRRHRPDLALLDILDGFGAATVDLFGYSGGAQLAHRFAMLYPNRAGDLHLGAAGWYTLPDADLPYPLGLRGHPLGAAMARALPAYLDRAITLHCGSADRKRDASLRKTPQLDALQGRHRLARAIRYASALRAASTAHGLTPRVRLNRLPGARHSIGDCLATGAMLPAIAPPCRRAAGWH